MKITTMACVVVSCYPGVASAQLKAHFVVLKPHVIADEPILVQTGFENRGREEVTVPAGFGMMSFEWRPAKGAWSSCTWQTPEVKNPLARVPTITLKPGEVHLEKIGHVYHQCKEIINRKNFWLRIKITNPSGGESNRSAAVEVIVSEPRAGDRSILAGYEFINLPTDGGPDNDPRIVLGDLLAGGTLASGNRSEFKLRADRAQEFVRTHKDFMFNELIEYNTTLRLTLIGEYAEARGIARGLSTSARQPRIKSSASELLKTIDELEFIVKPKWST